MAATKMSEHVALSEESVHNETYEVKQKTNFEDGPVEEKLDLLLEAEKLMRSDKANVLATFLSLSEDVATEYLITTEGTRVQTTLPKPSFYYFVTVKEGNKSAQRYWHYGGCGGFEVIKSWKIPELLHGEIRAITNNLKKSVKPPKKPIDIVCGPQVVGIMCHESVGHPHEADRIFGREAAQAGESFITRESIGTKIGTDIVTVVDDPLVEKSFGHYKYDNEGVKARRKFLIKNGKTNEFLHNRETAAAMGIKSNGSSRATQYNRESIVRMSNTFLLPGGYTEDELIREVKHGVYMKNFNEWNIDDKRLNQKYVGAECYLIENGELTKEVYQPTLEINTPDLWSSVRGIAKNTEYHAGTCGKAQPLQAIPVWFGGPSLLLRNIRLS